MLVKKLATHEQVEAGSRFIENQQFRLDSQWPGPVPLWHMSLGKTAQPLFGIELKLLRPLLNAREIAFTEACRKPAEFRNAIQS